MNALERSDMKIEQPTDNSLYVTIGNFTYYFDDSIDGENIVKRWRTDEPRDRFNVKDISPETEDE